MRFLFLLFFLILTNLLFPYSSGCSFQTIRSEIEHKKNRKRKKNCSFPWKDVDLYATLFHLRNARNSIPQIAKTLSPVYHLAVGTWNEQEGVRHRMSSKGEFANWNMRTKFFFIWWNPPPVLLYRATRSVRFHIHYDYLVACLLLPPSNSARRTGRIHTHTNKRIDWLTTTQPSEKRIVWRDRDLFQ